MKKFLPLSIFIFAFIFFLGFFCFTPSSHAAVTLVQDASGTDASFVLTATSSFKSAVTASDTIAALIEWVMESGTDTISSVTDSRGNTFTILTSTLAVKGVPSPYQNVNTEIAYATDTSVGADTVTVTLTPGAAAGIFANLLELTPSTLDIAAEATGSSTTPNAGTVTTGSNGEFGAAEFNEEDYNGNPNFTAGLGWTLFQNFGVGDGALAAEYQAQTNAGNITGNSTEAFSGPWSASMAVFKSFSTTVATSGNAIGYAWGDKLGWVNFGTSLGNFLVTASTVSGYAWSQNFGWINMAPASSGVFNDGNGNLSGYAWAENAGYIGFSGVTIDSGGVFHGVASGTVAGSLVFDSSTYFGNASSCTYCYVATTWSSTPATALTVSAVNINGTNPATITLTTNTTTNVNVESSISDNSCSEITGGTTTILLYRSGVTSSSCLTDSGNGVSNNLNCYLATAFTASSTCVAGTQIATTTFAVQYFAQATDASSSFPNQNWLATVIFKDSTNATSTADSTHSTSSNDFATTIALNVTTSSINYGQLAPSSTTGGTNQTTVIMNAGNASTTLQLSATQTLTKGANSIATSSQAYSTSTFTYPGTSTALSASAANVNGFLLTSPTSTTNVQSTIFWGLQVPNGTVSGTYSGTSLFTALFHS